MATEKEQNFKTLIILVKFLIGIVCIYVLYHFNVVDFSIILTSFDSIWPALFCFGLMVSTVFVGSLRWQRLMLALDAPITFTQSLNFTFIGQFFNVFLPGAYGGDFIRGGLAYQIDPTKISAIVMSNLFDRLVGLFSLLLIGLCFVAFIPSKYQFWMAVTTSALMVSMVLGLWLLARYKEFFIAMAGMFPGAIGRILQSIATPIAECTSVYFSHFSTLLVALLLSLVQWMLVLATLIIIGQAMAAETLPWMGFVVSGVAGLLGNALPISLGGLGVGEAVFAQTANALESTQSGTAFGTIFLVQRGFTLLTAALGVFFLLSYKKQISSARKSAMLLQKTNG